MKSHSTKVKICNSCIYIFAKRANNQTNPNQMEEYYRNEKELHKNHVPYNPE